jgi:hypothetical protein
VHESNFTAIITISITHMSMWLLVQCTYTLVFHDVRILRKNTIELCHLRFVLFMVVKIHIVVLLTGCVSEKKYLSPKHEGSTSF